MINVNFFNVGQGDTIAIDWEENGVQQFIIVDCKSVGRKKHPLVSYIEQFDDINIKFLILSHPHTDHFSGFHKLISYFRSKGVPTEYFLHTGGQTVDFIRTSVEGVNATRKVQKLFLLVRDMDNNNEIKMAWIDGNSPTRKVSLIGNYYLEFLSPTRKEYDNYVQRTSLANEEEAGNNPNANWLSTIMLIGNDDHYGLFTSDTETYPLKRVDREYLTSKPEIMRFGQIPHHGSDNNHNNTFWRKRYNQEGTAIISVGTNGYNHPNPGVVAFLRKIGYNVLATNDIVNHTTETLRTVSDLDSISENIAELERITVQL